mgnify:CR=1 FL=1
MNDTTKNMRTAEQLAALADTLERQAAAALHLAWQSDAAVQFLRCLLYTSDAADEL